MVAALLSHIRKKSLNIIGEIFIPNDVISNVPNDSIAFSDFRTQQI